MLEEHALTVSPHIQVELDYSMTLRTDKDPVVKLYTLHDDHELRLADVEQKLQEVERDNGKMTLRTRDCAHDGFINDLVICKTFRCGFRIDTFSQGASEGRSHRLRREAEKLREVARSTSYKIRG